MWKSDYYLNPNLTHPFYFICKWLYREIKQKAQYLDGKLMDFGCGTKPYKLLFAVKEYIGVDYSNEGHSHENENIDVFYDGVNLPFADNTFDSVFSSEVFEHIFNLEQIIAEIFRVMKPNAKLLFTCPFVWNEHEVPIDYARYSQFALSHLLKKNGFEIISSVKSGNFIEALFQLNILYFNPYLLKIPLLGTPLSKLFCLMTNFLGVLFSFMSNKRFDLYLSNIILAEKI